MYGRWLASNERLVKGGGNHPAISIPLDQPMIIFVMHTISKPWHTYMLNITRSGARFAHPLLVCEFWDCCFDWLEGRDRFLKGWMEIRARQGGCDMCGSIIRALSTVV